MNQLFYVLGFVCSLASGNFKLKEGNEQYGYVRPLQVKTIPFNRFFVAKIFKERNMFIHIGVEKVPVIKNGIIKRY